MKELTRYIDYLIIGFRMRNAMAKLHFFIKNQAVDINDEINLKRVISYLFEINDSIKIDNLISFIKTNSDLININEIIFNEGNFEIIKVDSYPININESIKISDVINTILAFNYLINAKINIKYNFNISLLKSKTKLFESKFGLIYNQNVNPKETKNQLIKIDCWDNMVNSSIAIYSSVFSFTKINELIQFIENFEIDSADGLLFYLDNKPFDNFQFINFKETTSDRFYIEEIIKQNLELEIKKSKDKLFLTNESINDCFKSNVLVTIEGTRTIGQMATLKYGDIANLTLNDLFYYIQ